MVWYSTWATSGALPALAAVSSLVISGSPATVSVAVTWMPGCEAFHTAVTLVMLGTQDQKVRLILPDDVDEDGEVGELQPAAASTVAATTTRVAATVLRPKDGLIAPPVPWRSRPAYAAPWLRTVVVNAPSLRRGSSAVKMLILLNFQ